MPGPRGQPSIRFSGNQGKIYVPRRGRPGEVQTFVFYLSSVGKDNPQESFECIKQYVTCEGSVRLECAGGIQHKIIVCATDDSYQKARQSMMLSEEETRSRGAVVIKPGRRYLGEAPSPRPTFPPRCKSGNPRRVCRTSPPAGSRHVPSCRPAPRRGARPYRKPDLVQRLQKDGLTAQDRHVLDELLQEVGLRPSRTGRVPQAASHSGSLVSTLHRDNTFTLKDAFFGEVRKDWPGYTEGDRQLLQRVLLRCVSTAIFVNRIREEQGLLWTSRCDDRVVSVSVSLKSAQSQNAPPVPCERPPDPLMDPTDLPPSQVCLPGCRVGPFDPLFAVLVTKRPKEFQDPLANKKPRISHLASKGAGPVNSKLGMSSRREGGEVWVEDKLTVSRILLPGVTRSSDPLSDVSNDSAHKRKDHEDPRAVKAEKLCPPPPGRGSAHFPLRSGTYSENNTKSAEGPCCLSDHKGACQSSAEPSGAAPKPSYLQKYRTVRSQAQRQEYKSDFNMEYSEYRRLHAHIEGVTRRFTELDSELRQLQPGTAAYETIHNQILQEYRNIKKANPTYSQEKSRCEFLHRKLAHIKKLIAEFDQRQLHGWT
ncbi:RNA polymerase II elongation factor ELL-like [Scleropages formosus]|uniref:RNA polymerase II elongation factor ELL-like n=1 Tax=Scleropages formosus TaxID=113540 RepID=A0A0P7YAN1_SCLFO|nr:RNA polymerase II elongation factor ELL-like [Scleropages formosus]